MTTKTKHTPTPWIFSEGSDGIGIYATIMPNELKPRWLSEITVSTVKIASLENTEKQNRPAKEYGGNAYFIVRACNQYEALGLVALAAGELRLYQTDREFHDAAHCEELERNLDVALSNLAKARGEQL